MERLTNKNLEQEMENAVIGEIPWAVSAWMRLCEIENILGDDYDLERLAELVKADREGRKPETAADVVEVVHGKWEPGNPLCPICGKNKFDGLDADVWADWNPPNCPNCGAKMDGE